MRTLADFLTDEDRAAIRAPISAARTFPQIAYRSQEFFELEVAQLFSRNWVAVGFAGSLPQVGDVAPVDIFGMPLLITRAEDQAIRVFHNIGAHDGCPIALVRQSRVTTLEAPYHFQRRPRHLGSWSNFLCPDILRTTTAVAQELPTQIRTRYMDTLLSAAAS